MRSANPDMCHRSACSAARRWPPHLTCVSAPYWKDLGAIQEESLEVEVVSSSTNTFQLLSLKLKRWEVCKYADKDKIWYLLSLPVRSSSSFAIFTRGSRNIRPVKEVFICRARRVLVKVSWYFLLYSPVFSCLWLLSHYIPGLNFSLLWVCIRLPEIFSQINPVFVENQARAKASWDEFNFLSGSL